MPDEQNQLATLKRKGKRSRKARNSTSDSEGADLVQGDVHEILENESENTPSTKDSSSEVETTDKNNFATPHLAKRTDNDKVVTTKSIGTSPSTPVATVTSTSAPTSSKNDWRLVWNIPNILSVSRAVCLPVFIATHYYGTTNVTSNHYYTALVFALLAATDFLDGFI